MQSLVLLHGALGSDRQMEPLKEHLSKNFDVHTLCFEGHGERSTDRPLAISNFSENLRDFLKDNDLEKPIIFGYSMGGYVALYTEALFSGSFRNIVTLGTKFNWTPDVAAREVRMLQPDIVEEKVPKFAAHLDRMHQPNDWKTVMRNTAEMMEAMGENPPLNDVDLSKVSCPVQMLVGTKDTMVSEAETRVIQQQLTNAKLDLLDEVEHPIEKLNLDLVDRFIEMQVGLV